MKYLVYILMMFFLGACSKEEQGSKHLVKKNFFNPKDSEYSFTIAQPLQKVGNDSVVKWKGYQKMMSELAMYKNITPHEILRKSNQLLGTALLMKDSIPSGALQTIGLKPRVNAIYCQVLRIHDMKSIPSIKATEIVSATEELFQLQSMLHQKINALYQQLYFDIDLNEEDYFFGFKKDSLL